MQKDFGSVVKELLTRGRERGFITCDELNEALPSDQVTSGQMEDVIAMLSECGISLRDSPQGPSIFPRPIDPELVIDVPLDSNSACARTMQRLETALAALRSGRTRYACDLMDAALKELQAFSRSDNATRE